MCEQDDTWHSQQEEDDEQEQEEKKNEEEGTGTGTGGAAGGGGGGGGAGGGTGGQARGTNLPFLRATTRSASFAAPTPCLTSSHRGDSATRKYAGSVQSRSGAANT
jgi:hypothetical protein